MEGKVSINWDKNYTISSSELSEIVEDWGSYSQSIKAGIIVSFFRIKRENRPVYEAIIPKFLDCLERDPDAEINMFHPLASNFVAGAPFYFNLPQDCVVKKVANIIIERLRDATLSYCPMDSIMFPFRYKEGQPLASKQKNNDIPLDQDLAWEDCWACPDPGPAQLPPIRQPTKGEKQQLARFMSASEASSSRRSVYGVGPSKTGVRPSARRGSNFIGKPHFKPSQIPRPGFSLAKGAFEKFKPPEPKVKLIDLNSEPNPLLNDARIKLEAKKYIKERAQEEKERKREALQRNESEAKRNDKMIRAAKRKGRKFSNAQPRDPRGAPRPKAAPSYSVTRNSSPGYSLCYSPKYASKSGAEDTLVSTAVSEAEDDMGHSPPPYMIPSPGSPIVECISVTKEDDMFPPEVAAALNFTKESGQSQAMLPRIKPTALKADKQRPCPPPKLPEDAEDKLEQIHDLLTTCPFLNPADSAFIRQCLDGNFIKPRHLSSNEYSVVLSLVNPEPAGSSSLTEMKHFEVYFRSNGQSSWDLKTEAVKPSTL